jgi:uncharacterized FlaG/YvyC family protein
MTLKVPALEDNNLLFSVQTKSEKWIELISGKVQPIQQNLIFKIPRVLKNLRIKVFEKNGDFYY